MKISHKWEPITDLPASWQSLASDRLKHLAQTWIEQKDKLNAKAVLVFTEKLKRQWAIETGMIEGLYTLDRGITQTLIERGLDAIDIPHKASKHPHRVKRLIKDQESVVDGLFSFVKGERPLSTSYVKEIHAELTRSQDTTEALDSFGKIKDVKLLRGDWKKMPNNPSRLEDGTIHEYCPPEHVAAEMDQLIKWHHEHMAAGIPPEVEAAWLHHRFTQIHPFQDGNGRVARALAALVFLRQGWFPLVVTNDSRSDYIEALEYADQGNLEKLIDLFTQLATNEFLKALAISEGIVEAQRTKDAVLNAIQKTLQSHVAFSAETSHNAFCIANRLKKIIEKFLEEIEHSLSEIFPEGNTFGCSVLSSSPDNSHYYRSQLYEVGDKFNYYVNIERFHAWVRLQIRNARRCSIVASIHSVDKNFLGIMAATVFMEYREVQDGFTNVDGPFSLCKSPFIFTGKDSLCKIEPAFQEWLQESVLQGLVEWQQKL